MEQSESNISTAGPGIPSSPSTLTDAQKKQLRFDLVETARKLLGIKYVYGAEWVNFLLMPPALDCSELVEGVFSLHKLKMPDGGQNQFNFTIPTSNPLPADLAFFGRGGNIDQVYHVGMVFDLENMIEARGLDPKASFETGKVILRGRKYWEAFKPGFLGYRAHPLL